MQAFGLARLGRDAEIRDTADGQVVANLSLAFEFRSKGEKSVQWVDASLWGKRAESLAPYLKKGSRIVVTLQDVCIESYKKADGTPASKLVGRVAEIELAGDGQQRSAPPAQAPAAAPRPAPRPAPRTAAPPTSTGFDDMDSDIPF